MIPNNLNGSFGKILFFDDFNDNIKDHGKWTEIYSEGTWEEMNQRAEFKLYEAGSGSDYEGIESKEFTISLSLNQELIISWDLTTNIGSTTSTGGIWFEVTDGTNWIKANYERWHDETRYRDSNDETYTILNSNKGDGSWNNEIKIFSDRYLVRMDADSSGPIYDTLFSSNATLNVRLYVISCADQPSLYFRSGYDNVYVYYANQPPEIPIIYGPLNGKAGRSYVYSASTIDPDKDKVYYWFDWGDGTNSGWTGPYESGVTASESHIWNAQGEYIVKVKAKDIYEAESTWATQKVTMPKNKAFIFNFLLLNWLFERFPLLQKLLNFILN